jgi:hypothetical protein
MTRTMFGFGGSAASADADEPLMQNNAQSHRTTVVMTWPSGVPGTPGRLSCNRGPARCKHNPYDRRVRSRTRQLTVSQGGSPLSPGVLPTEYSSFRHSSGVVTGSVTVTVRSSSSSSRPPPPSPRDELSLIVLSVTVAVCRPELPARPAGDTTPAPSSGRTSPPAARSQVAPTRRRDTGSVPRWTIARRRPLRPAPPGPAGYQERRSGSVGRRWNCSASRGRCPAPCTRSPGAPEPRPGAP